VVIIPILGNLSIGYGCITVEERPDEVYNHCIVQQSYSPDEIAAFQKTVPKTPQELWDWVNIIWNIQIPKKRCCRDKNHVPPFEAFCYSFFAWGSMCVWHASRGFGGKSYQLAALSLTEAVILASNIKLLGGSTEQARRIYGYFDGTDTNAAGQFWQAPFAPVHLNPHPERVETNLTNGGHISCLAASPTSIRGAHPQRLRIDEADEIPLRLYDAAMGQTMSVKSDVASAQTTVSSTWQHPNGTFTEVLKRAKEHGYPLFQWCHEETSKPHGWLPVSEIERKKKETTKQMWAIEYELCEPLGENRVFDSPAVEAVFDPDLGFHTGGPGETYVFEGPQPGVAYYHGTDWAKSVDWTVVQSMRRCADGPDRLVAWKRMGRKPWPSMVADQEQQVKAYGGASAHDITGIGNVLNDYLTFPSDGVTMAGKTRSELFGAYITAIEHRLIRMPRIEWAYLEHLYCTWDDLYGSSGHAPDSIVAGAMAWRARGGPPAAAASFEIATDFIGRYPISPGGDQKALPVPSDFKPSGVEVIDEGGYWSGNGVMIDLDDPPMGRRRLL
jgi:hypothetical protein